MSLIYDTPMCDWWDANYTISLVDQFFGDVLVESDLLKPSHYRGFAVRYRTDANIEASGKSLVPKDPKVFMVSLDMSQFKPEEIDVLVHNNFVVVHAKHEEKMDDHGYISRQFRRRYMLPRDCEQEEVTSKLESGGMLVIQAPRGAPSEERKIPMFQEQVTAAEDKKSVISI